MSQFYKTLEGSLATFLREQHLFFVSTAAPEGRINLSPKGGATLRVIDERTIAYLDLTGSAAETSAHLRQDARITVMACSFDARALIVRIYGRGRAVRPGDPEWATWLAHFDATIGQRQVIVVDVESVQTSCGYAVPRYELVAERDALTKWAESKGEDGLREYRRQKNQVSIDGFPTGLGED